MANGNIKIKIDFDKQAIELIDIFCKLYSLIPDYQIVEKEKLSRN